MNTHVAQKAFGHAATCHLVLKFQFLSTLASQHALACPLCMLLHVHLVQVLRQSYFFDSAVKHMAVSQTMHGISNKFLLVGTMSDQVCFTMMLCRRPLTPPPPHVYPFPPPRRLKPHPVPIAHNHKGEGGRGGGWDREQFKHACFLPLRLHVAVCPVAPQNPKGAHALASQ